MKFSIYFIFSFLLFANINLYAEHKPNTNGLKQEGTSSSLYSPKNTNGISYDSAILIKWPLNKNGQFNIAGIVYGKLVNNKFVVNRTRIKVQSINISQKLGDILTDNAPIVFEKMVGGVSQGVGVPMDTAILIKWPPVKSGNKFTTVSSMVTGYIQDGDFLFAQQGNRLISTTVGKYGDILIDDVPIPPFDRRAGGGEPEKPKGCYCVEEPTPGTFTGVNVDCPGGDCVKCCADVKKQGGTRVPVPAEVALAISKGQYTGDWGDKKYYFNEVKPETTTLSQISTNWNKTKYPYGIVVFNNSKYGYDKAENIQEWMKDNKNLKGKGEMPVPVFIIPISPKDTTIQAANGAGTRLAAGNASTKPGLKRTVVVAPPNNTPFFPEIVYGENNRLVKCTDKDGNDYYVNCPEGTGNCCDLAPLPQIDLTTPAENNGNPDGGTKPKPETTTLSQISTNWDKTKYPYGIVVFNNSKYDYDKAENIQEWMKDNKNLKGKGEMPVPVFIVPVMPKDTARREKHHAAFNKKRREQGFGKRVGLIPPPNNTPFFPEIVYGENTRLVKCTDKDGNDYYVNCPEGTGNCCDLAPLPQIDLTTPAENNGNPDGGTKPKPETTTLSGILANWDKTKNPYGIVVFKNSQFVYDKAENIQEWMKGFKKLKGKKEKGYEAFYIIPTTPKDTFPPLQAANGAGTRLASTQASNKPGLKRIEMVSPPNNSPSSPEIIYDANTRLVKCTDKDGNDYYVNCPEGTGNCCDLAPLPFIDLTSPEKQESFGSGNNHPDSTMSFKWPEDFNNSAYKDLKFEPNAILIGKDGKKHDVKFDSHSNYRFVVFKDISTDYTFLKMPAGTLFLTPFNDTYAGFNKPSIFVTMPQGSVKANGAGTRLATSQASAKPGLKRLTPPPAPIGATVPQGEILFKNNGGGIKIDTAIVIYWPPVNGKDDYRQIPPPNNNMVVFSAGIVNDFKPFAENPEDRHGRLVLSRRKAKLMLAWQGLIRTNSDNDNDEYNIAESINDAKNMDKSNLGVLIDTIQVIKWPEDFKKPAYKEASFEAMATYVAADGKFYFIDLDSDGDGLFDVDELASKIPAGTMLLKRGAKSKTANNSNFHKVSFTKNGDTLPTYTMQIALPNGSNMDKLFEMSDQAQNYKMREIISLHIGQAGRQNINNEKDIPIALPYFDTNGNLLFWATKDAITLTYEKNAVNSSSIAKNNKYDMDTFKAFYKTLINDYPTFAYPQFKKDRLRAVPHTESSIEAR